MSLIPTPTSAARTLTSLGVATLREAHRLRRRTDVSTAHIGPVAPDGPLRDLWQHPLADASAALTQSDHPVERGVRSQARRCAGRPDRTPCRVRGREA